MVETFQEFVDNIFQAEEEELKNLAKPGTDSYLDKPEVAIHS